jgi:hypothetical protein
MVPSPVTVVAFDGPAAAYPDGAVPGMHAGSHPVYANVPPAMQVTAAGIEADVSAWLVAHETLPNAATVVPDAEPATAYAAGGDDALHAGAQPL